MKFEKHKINKKSVKVSAGEMKKALAAVSDADLKVMKTAAGRIRAFHERQVPKSFIYDDGQGTVIEERVIPLERVGICVPGGSFPLASTVLMTAIPARLAGVEKIVMISPWPQGVMNPHVLAAAHLAKVDEIYKVGGAQGVAALAYGTESVPWVDKIVGPGSVWVTQAKAEAQARGLCDIDCLAGPSEIVIVADETARAELIALDLLSQVEHGEDSKAALVTTSEELAKKVARELGPKNSLPDNLAHLMLFPILAYVVKDLDMAAEGVNMAAPEHLEVMVRSPKKFIRRIKNAASIFVGPYSPVPAGDYLAGANHVLPTAGGARFSSPLGVYDFVKRQSITTLSRSGLESIKDPCIRFAELEGLSAHAEAVKRRFPTKARVRPRTGK